MKKVFLIGDSVRIGYDKYVKEALKGKAEVYYTPPQESARFALYTLRNIHEWKNQLNLSDDIDLVHWNVGLWDSLILYNDGPLTEITDYEKCIERICRRIKVVFPDTKMTFATSTPVIEERFTTPDISKRYNKDIIAYNEVAVNTVKKYGGEINDLYKIVKSADISYYSDMTHLYTEKGTILLTKAVVTSICKTLEIDSSDINYEDVIKNYKKITKFSGQ